MKILLFGGTGAIGSELAKILDGNNDEIFITTRSEKKNTGNIKYIVGNSLENNFIKSVLKDRFDCIVDFMTYENLELFESRLSILLDNTDNYIFLSSSKVYANSNEILNEKSVRLLETLKNEDIDSNDYSVLKCKEEDLLINFGKKNYTIIRPYITYNNNRLQLGIYEKEGWLFRALDDRTIIVSEDILNKKTTLSFAGDVAKYISDIIYKEKGKGEIFQITTGRTSTWKDVLDVYKKVLLEKNGRTPKIKVVKNLYDIKMRKPDYKYEYDRKFDRIFDSSKVQNYTGLSGGKNIEEGLKICLENFLEKPSFLEINYEEEAIKDKKTKERIKLKSINGIKNKVLYIVYRYTPAGSIKNFARNLKKYLK